MKLREFITPIILASTVALSACGGEAEVVAEPEVEGVPGLSVENARLVLPAVKGNPAAVYFDVAYEGDRGLSIRRADVAGAKEAQLHAFGEWEGRMQMAEAMPIAITKGTEVTFAPGELHVMAFELDDSIEAGGNVEVTLTVSGGGTHTFEADVLAAGDDR